jgi:hypothetical protein
MRWAPVIAMCFITILEAIALCFRIDGTTLSLVVAALAGLGGYELKVYIDRRKGGK